MTYRSTATASLGDEEDVSPPAGRREDDAETGAGDQDMSKSERTTRTVTLNGGAGRGPELLT